MGTYSIKELECLSGIKAHTLRIWEKRFNLFKPERTDTNIRYYSDEDLKKVLNISLLTMNGHRISEIASLSDEELCKAIVEVNNYEIRNLKRINELILTLNELNEQKFHELFAKYESSIGFEKTITEIIYPYLEKVGVLWLSGEIQAVQEHLISSLIRSKIITAIEQLPFPKSANKKALLFLPEGEYHELGLLFFCYLLKKNGVHVYYLGQSNPLFQISAFLEKTEVDYVFTYSIVKNKIEIEEMLEELSTYDQSQTFYIESKFQSKLGIAYPANIKTLSTFKDALSFVLP